MATRRMFSLSVVDSDRFLDMPLTAQALYFHFGMHADDDGFIKNPRRLFRSIGAALDDMNILISKGYIIPFESGVVVITDWRQNNRIRKDRYTPTTCPEISMLDVDLYEKYTKIQSGIPNDNQMTTNRLPGGVHSIGKDRLVKDRLVKDRLVKDNIYTINFETEFLELWEMYPRKQGKKKALESYIKARESGETFEAIKEGLQRYVKYVNDYKLQRQYIRYASTWFAKQSWNDEIVECEKGDILDGIL